MKKLIHSELHRQKRQNLGISFQSHLFTFHLLVQLLLPTVKLNGVSQEIQLIQDGV